MENLDMQGTYFNTSQSDPASHPDSPEQESTTLQAAAAAQQELLKTMQSLLAGMQELRQDFDTKLKYDESKERQLDSMHRELQTYREGLHFKILRPLFIDLIAVYDDLGKLIDGLLSKEVAPTLAQMIDNLQSFQDTIEDILNRNGAESYNLDGDTYVPSKQRVLQVVDTGDTARDKQIARRVRKGFEYEGRVIRPELVILYRTVSNNAE